MTAPPDGDGRRRRGKWGLQSTTITGCWSHWTSSCLYSAMVNWTWSMYYRTSPFGFGCYKRKLHGSDIFARMSATSRACPDRGIWRMIQHTDKGAALYTAAGRRLTNQVSARQAERESRPTTRPSRLTSSQWSSRECRACRACRRGCHEDAARKLQPWNSSCTRFHWERTHF